MLDAGLQQLLHQNVPRQAAVQRLTGMQNCSVGLRTMPKSCARSLLSPDRGMPKICLAIYTVRD